jgi:hypothetical protein
VEQSRQSYTAVEDAIRAWAEFSCVGDGTKGGYVRVAYLRRDKQLIALGTGLTLAECLAAVEQDCKAGGKTAREFDAAHCSVCAMNQLAPTGSLDAVSALDGYLLAPNRGFAVAWDGNQFRLTAHWWRQVRTPREIIQQVIRDRILVRWEHGDFAFETFPVRGKKNWLAQTKKTSRPPACKKLYPTEERQIVVLGGSLRKVLVHAEEPISAALREDDAWYRLTQRCT